jgi:4-hydroxy-tetrahydrodipicolinate synthase
VTHSSFHTSGRPDSALGGIVCATLTPLTADGEIDIGRMASHIRGLFADGCSFVSPFGSTGEGPSFSVAQKLEALRGLNAMGIASDRLIPASMSPALDDIYELVRFAAGEGYRAALIAPPFYYGSASQEGIADVFAALADRFGGALPIDIILYHIPQLTGIPFGVDLVRALRQRHGARIAGIKDSTGDHAHTLMLQRNFPDLAIFTGDDRVLPDLLLTGGAGMIGGLPNIVAADLCAIARDPGGAGTAELRANAALRIEAIDALGGISALKAVKARLVADPQWRATMPPLRALSESDSAELFARLRHSKFAFGPEPV